MAKNPVNLLARFILELTALVALGIWGWTQHEGALRWVAAIGAPLLAATAWGVFRVPDDPGPAPVRLSGVGRLLLEAIFFGTAVAALLAAGRPTFAAIFGAAIVIHYGLSWDRLTWLVRQ